MKRYVCTVAVGFVLALMGTATASANDLLPVPGQEATQVTEFGDQDVGEQKNDADVTQAQGNGNLNLSPAIAIGGDAETTNEQGNDNVAKSDIDQENDVDQSQDATQKQELDQNGSSGGCCTDQSQSGEQKVYGGDQSVEEQKNDADVTQAQGNGNVNIAPAIAVFGDAETTNEQGNDNVAKSEIDQENDVDQSQDSTQKQEATQTGGSCCESNKGYGKHDGKECGCNDGQSQTGEQKTSFGDQWVGEQKNDADVTQKQGNGNVNIAPAVAIFGDAKTTNKQGNGNYASSDIDQKNDVDQSQDSYQRQSLDQSGTGCCGSGQSQTGEQRVYGGDQSVDKQKNDADVDQWQGNGNLNIAPAIAVFGDAETKNYQGNGNVAKSDIDQKNDVDQSQSSTQKQELNQSGGSCCERENGYGKHENGKECGCDGGQSQTGEQKTSFGDQWVGEQKNEADVTQKQGNWNGSFAPAIAIGGKHEKTCNSRCGNSFHPVGGNATTTNAQGNGNYASSDIDQKNDVDQSQDSYQRQSLDQSGSNGCCSGSQTGEQRVYGGDQSVEKQKNDADVDQWQGTGNGSFAPAVALGGDATTRNYQGNGNVAKSDIDQKNDVDQSQSSTQKQSLTQEGGDCCKPTHDCCKPSYGHEPKEEYGRESSPNCSSKCEPKKEYSREKCGCESKSGQSGEQKTSFGDQSVGEQKNDADVTQKQGNWNGSFAPAFAFGGHQNSCNSTCTKSKSVHPVGGSATTINKQGNGNYAKSDIDQKNDAEQSQDAYQWQTLVTGREVAYR
jgi:hypothetical protein